MGRLGVSSGRLWAFARPDRHVERQNRNSSVAEQSRGSDRAYGFFTCPEMSRQVQRQTATHPLRNSRAARIERTASLPVQKFPEKSSGKPRTRPLRNIERPGSNVRHARERVANSGVRPLGMLNRERLRNALALERLGASRPDRDRRRSVSRRPLNRLSSVCEQGPPRGRAPQPAMLTRLRRGRSRHLRYR
jgi:hypothetical protein